MSFYDKSWRAMGLKSELASELSRASRVPFKIFDGSKSVSDYPIAQRMHWAAGRATTRVEDRAYSLIGLFNVNMPMLYGEGARAFTRLQEEIIKHSDDHSIFAWKGVDQGGSGLLAESPDNFADAHCAMILSETSDDMEPYSMTNLGLSIRLRMTPWRQNTYAAWLNCTMNLGGYGQENNDIVIFLFRTRGQRFRRVTVPNLDDYVVAGTLSNRHRREFQQVQVYVEQSHLSTRQQSAMPPDYLLHFSMILKTFSYVTFVGEIDTGLSAAVLSPGRWDPMYGLVELEPGHTGRVATIDLQYRFMPFPFIIVASGFEFHPKLVIVAEDQRHRARKNPEVYLELAEFTKPEIRGYKPFRGFQLHEDSHGMHTFEMIPDEVAVDIWFAPVTTEENERFFPRVRIAPSELTCPKLWRVEYTVMPPNSADYRIKSQSQYPFAVFGLSDTR